MHRHLRSFTLTFALIAATFIAACGSSSNQGTQLAKNQTLTLANVGVSEIATFDPALPSDLNSAEAIQLAYSGLLTLDASTLQVKPDIATAVPTPANGGISSDNLTYTFHLQSGLKFSNGDPVTATDFAFAIDRTLAPCLKSNVATVYLGMIKGALDRNAGTVKTIIGTGVTAVDDTTLKIVLAQPSAYFLNALTYSTAFALDPKVVPPLNESSPASCTGSDYVKWTEHPVGTGPFIMKEWDHNQQMIFAQNPYWYGSKLKITQITMPFVKSLDTAYRSYKAKEIDMDGLGNPLTSDEYVDAKQSLGKQLTDAKQISINYEATNWNVAPFDNPHVRLAFAEAMDRDTIAHQTLKDSAISSDHIVPNGMPGYFAGLKGIPFNAQGAKAELQKAYPDPSKMPTITLTYPAVGDTPKVAEQIQQDVKTYLGVNIQLNGEDFEKVVNDVYTNKIQFYLLAWIADYPDPQDWLSNQFEKGVPNNTLNFNDPNFDKLCQQADSDPDQTHRISLYNQAEELAVDEVAWIPYIQLKNTYVTQPWVQGFKVDGEGLIPDYTWGDVSVTQH